MPPAEKVHVGVAAAVECGSDLLLVQRGSRASYADGYGTWGLPGGWLEWGETAFDAARREVEEEVGLFVRPVEEDGYHVHTAATSGLHVVTLFVRCEYSGGIPRNLEPDKQLAVRWVARETMVELDLFAPLDAWWRRPRAVA
jgi:8-oxo-dGTP diphosphatase